MKTENWELKVNDNINTLKAFFRTSAPKAGKSLLILIRLILISKMRIIVNVPKRLAGLGVNDCSQWRRQPLRHQM